MVNVSTYIYVMSINGFIASNQIMVFSRYLLLKMSRSYAYTRVIYREIISHIEGQEGFRRSLYYGRYITVERHSDVCMPLSDTFYTFNQRTRQCCSQHAYLLLPQIQISR